jgi:16S rRNA (guanine966-N2)-methyltransferase
MRIIGGTLKGRAIKTPEGRTTRPTSDRVRESLFNILAHAPWSPGIEGRRVLDLFAGTGALGFEALSRGAAHCLFVETDEAARGIIRTNIDSFQLFGRTRVHRRSATDLGPRPGTTAEAFDLVFLDAPYNMGLSEAALQSALKGAWFAPQAVVIVETAAAEPFAHEGLAKLDHRVYGVAALHILQYGPASAGADMP